MNASIQATEQLHETFDMKARLSTMWIFILLNMIFRDIHELFRPGYLAEIMTGIVNGTQMSNDLLLVAGIVLEMPIAMIVFSRILDYRLNRWLNIIAAILTLLFALNNGVNDPDDVWFLCIGVIGLLYIIWSAWTWSNHEAQA